MGMVRGYGMNNDTQIGVHWMDPSSNISDNCLARYVVPLFLQGMEFPDPYDALYANRFEPDGQLRNRRGLKDALTTRCPLVGTCNPRSFAKDSDGTHHSRTFVADNLCILESEADIDTCNLYMYSKRDLVPLYSSLIEIQYEYKIVYKFRHSIMSRCGNSPTLTCSTPGTDVFCPVFSIPEFTFYERILGNVYCMYNNIDIFMLQSGNHRRSDARADKGAYGGSGYPLGLTRPSRDPDHQCSRTMMLTPTYE